MPRGPSILSLFTALAVLANAIPSHPFATHLAAGCPKSCQAAGPDPGNWTHIHDQGNLVNCDLPLLFDFNIGNEPVQHGIKRTCAVSTKLLPSDAHLASGSQSDDSDVIEPSSGCGAAEATTDAPISASPDRMLKTCGDAAEAARMLATYIADGASCGTTVIFAKSGDAVVGLYVGADVQKESAGEVVGQFG